MLRITFDIDERSLPPLMALHNARCGEAPFEISDDEMETMRESWNQAQLDNPDDRLKFSPKKIRQERRLEIKRWKRANSLAATIIEAALKYAELKPKRKA